MNTRKRRQPRMHAPHRSERSPRTQVCLSPEVFAELERVAEREERSKSALAARLIREGLERIR